MKHTYTLLALASLLTPTLAHMEMNNPPPFCSKFDTKNPCATTDYSYTSPLQNAVTGANSFPCKGYTNLNSNPVATYAQGSTYTMNIDGGAPHGGGSCQLSLSYDSSSTFHVIKSILGGCTFEKTSYDFTIPHDAPTGKAVFSWSWFNLIGNREMYMNCALVEITAGSGGGGNSSSGAGASASFDSLPNIFKANLALVTDCKTVEEQQVIFPDPGPVIEYGAGLGPSNLANAIKCDSSSGGGSGGGSTAPSSTSTVDTPPPPPPPSTMITSYSSSSPTTAPTSTSSIPGGVFVGLGGNSSVSTDAGASVPTAASTSTSTGGGVAAVTPLPAPNSTGPSGSSGDGAPSGVSPGGSCSPGAMRCDSPSSWSMCTAAQVWVSMGSVAAGMTCTGAGEMVRASVRGRRWW